jgi:hypothetical protein
MIKVAPRNLMPLIRSK